MGTTLFARLAGIAVWLGTGTTLSSCAVKELGKAGRESDEDQKVRAHAEDDSPAWARTDDWRTRVYSSSLAITVGLVFVASWLTSRSPAGRPTTRSGCRTSRSRSRGASTS